MGGPSTSGAQHPPDPEAALTLEAKPECASEARSFIVATLSDWRADRYLEIATLLTSEVVTNAILHADSPTVDVRVRLSSHRLRVEVRDYSALRPSLASPGLLSSTGRGLSLVEALSAGWGVDGAPDGKVVWFEVAS